MFKKLGSVLLGVTLLLGIAACTDAVETEAAGVYVSVDINPSIEFIVDEEDNVESYNLLNEDAEILCADLDFIGMNVEDAVELFIQLATEAGFIDVDSEDNAVLITVLGDEDDEELCEQIQTRVRNRVMRYMATHYINGEVFTEDFTQGDLVEQAQELGVSPGKLKIALLAQTNDPELLLEDALEMPVKDLMSKVKAQYNENNSERTSEELAEKLQQKTELMTRNQTRLQDHLDANPELTEEEIEQIMEQIRNRIQTRTRTSWEEIAEEWKTRQEERQQNTNESHGN